MNYDVKISNSNMVIGNIKELNAQENKKDESEKEMLLDFLFEPIRSEGLDSFIKA